jgi:serine/threonine protein kinase
MWREVDEVEEWSGMETRRGWVGGRERGREEGLTTLQVVMEYMSGGSLYDLVQRYPTGFFFTEAEIAYIIAETLNAVAFLHSLKRIHRDIKVGGRRE